VISKIDKTSDLNIQSKIKFHTANEISPNLCTRSTNQIKLWSIFMKSMGNMNEIITSKKQMGLGDDCAQLSFIR
jgi:hypothetical protein